MQRRSITGFSTFAQVPFDQINEEAFTDEGLSTRQTMATFLTELDYNSKQSLQAVIHCIDIWVCAGNALDRLGMPLYVEIAFKPNVANTVSEERRFWHFIFMGHRETEMAEQLKTAQSPASLAIGDSARRRPVYVPAEAGHPFGLFFQQFIKTRRMARGFFVAMYGFGNPRMCESCAQGYTSTVSLSNKHICAPFFGCVSLPGVAHGACANCIAERVECSYVQLPRAFGGVASVRGGSAVLNHDSAPRLTNEWPGLRRTVPDAEARELGRTVSRTMSSVLAAPTSDGGNVSRSSSGGSFANMECPWRRGLRRLA